MKKLNLTKAMKNEMELFIKADQYAKSIGDKDGISAFVYAK